MRVFTKLVFLLGVDLSKLPLSNERVQQRDKLVAKSVVSGCVSRHVNQFSVYQLFVVSLLVGKAFEVFNRKFRGNRCHDDYFNAYAVRIDSDLSPASAAWAPASLAIGTRYGEHET